MSTTTFLEYPDAQMLDYSADTDFTMHATGHVQEWLPVEATMSDDNISREYSETIEIDMEHNEDDEITEYEMADGEEAYRDEVVELQDVDFTESSRVHSPAAVSGISSPVIVDAPPESLSAISHTLSSHPSAMPQAAFVSPQDYASDVADQHPAANAEALFGSSSTPLSASEDSAHPLVLSISLPTTVTDGTPVEPYAAPEQPASPTRSAPMATPPHEEPLPSSLEGEDDKAGPDGQGETGVVVEHSVPADAGNAPAEQAELQQPADDSGLVLEGDRHGTSSSDPHQLSDGVFIDPPPPVLLSVSTGNQRTECCLFNQPQPRSRSQSPNAYASTSTARDVALLLSQRPTLYYEPLNSVFEALRQEEAVNSDAEFLDGELVLEAYDLNLRISEDNIHTGEVTLHELNILHDGIDLTGPLRLRLSSIPRFITRYHALREQVAQLSLASGLDGGVHPEGDQPEDESPEHANEFPDAEDSAPYSEPAETDGQTEQTSDENTQRPAADEAGVSELPVEAATDAEEHTAEEADEHRPLTSADDTEDHTDNETTDDAENAEGEDPEEASAEYGTELTAEEAAEGLDADEVHRDHDAEEGGDYTDYEERPADDEEEFGEALPEGAGGPEEDGDSQHEVLPDPYVPASTGNDVSDLDAPSGEASTALNADTVETTDPPDGNPTKIADGADISDNRSRQGDADSVSGTAQEAANTEGYTDLGEIEEFGEFEDDSDDQDNQPQVHAAQEPEELGEYEDDEDDDISSNVRDDVPSSMHSSTTLSTRSKRSREDEDEDEDGNEDDEGNPPGSPDSKRARVQ